MYGKIFEQIYDSSIMEEDLITRYVFMSMIVLSDKNGVLDVTRPALARRINITIDQANKAINSLLLPDEASRSKIEDGRRIIPIDSRDWGWVVVNKGSYRDLSCKEEKREKDRIRISQKRNINKNNNVAICRNMSQSVANVAYTDTDTDTKKELTLLSGKPDANRKLKAEAKEILEFLNAKTGRNYQPVDANLKLIEARLKTASLQDCKSIIAKKCREWAADEKMSPYLRPATLFNATKFAQYHGELFKQENSHE